MAECLLGYIKFSSFEEEGVIGISVINIHNMNESIHSRPSLLIHWGVHPKSYLLIYLFLLLLRSHFDGLITISFKALDTPKRTLEMLPFGFRFIVDIHKSSIFAKAYRIKVWCYWENFGNKLGTYWEQKKNKKKFSLTNPKEKTWALLTACGAFSLVAWTLRS
jgi:hypothetical protein